MRTRAGHAPAHLRQAFGLEGGRVKKVLGQNTKDRMAPFVQDFLPTEARAVRQRGGEDMPGPRQKLIVLEANGRKHLSKSEKAQRAPTAGNT